MHHEQTRNWFQQLQERNNSSTERRREFSPQSERMPHDPPRWLRAIGETTRESVALLRERLLRPRGWRGDTECSDWGS